MSQFVYPFLTCNCKFEFTINLTNSSITELSCENLLQQREFLGGSLVQQQDVGTLGSAVRVEKILTNGFQTHSGNTIQTRIGFYLGSLFDPYNNYF